MLDIHQFFQCAAPTVFVTAETLASLPIFEGLYAVENAFLPEEAAARETARRKIAARRNR